MLSKKKRGKMIDIRTKSGIFRDTERQYESAAYHTECDAANYEVFGKEI